MKKFAAITMSAIFAMGVAQAANNGEKGDAKINFSNAFAYGHDKNNVPSQNNGMGNAFGMRDKAGAGMNNSIRNTYPLTEDPTTAPQGLGNAFGQTP